MIDYLISALSIFSIYLITEKKKVGLYIGLFSQPFWAWLIFATHQYGLIPVNLAYSIIYIRGIKKWK